jgi:PD-(D/E)XK nuclease superfamily protein
MRKGVHCPIDDAEISDHDCFSCKHGVARPASGVKCQFSYEQLRAMFDDTGRESAGISATMLGGICPRQTWLKQKTDWYANPERNYDAYRGTLSHLMLEQHPEPGSLAEHRFELLLPNGRKVTGKVDKIHPGQRKITDFKSKAEHKDAPEKVDAGYKWQLNVYRYLVYHGSPQEAITHDATGVLLEHPYLPGEPAQIEIDELELNYWTFGWVKTLPVTVLPQAKVLEYLMKGTSAQYEDTPPPVPSGLDPGIKRASVFCEKWCPVRTQCLSYLLDE